jgi:hypothetical protein
MDMPVQKISRRVETNKALASGRTIFSLLQIDVQIEMSLFSAAGLHSPIDIRRLGI